jgi:hypothetical protein
MTPDGRHESQDDSKGARSISRAADIDEPLEGEEGSTHKELVLVDPGSTAPKRSQEAEGAGGAGESEVPPPKSAGGPQPESGDRSSAPASTTDPGSKEAPSGKTEKSTAGHEQSHEPPRDKPKEPPRPISADKVKMQNRLPALEDDAEVGRQKEQIVVRDGKADLGFTGTLLSSAASSAPKGRWQEYRVYSTESGKHVFSKITRSIFAEETDKHEADVFDPSPTSVPSQLLRSAREMTRSRPMTWTDAAVSFFGYDPLAKILYRKLSVDFEERV